MFSEMQALGPTEMLLHVVWNYFQVYHFGKTTAGPF